MSTTPPRRRPSAQESIGHDWLEFWRSLFSTSRSRQSGRTFGLRFESLEARRVMYGADLISLAEGEAGSPVADVSLTDVNPASSSFNQSVSPSDFLQQASAWYFGHST